MFGEGQVTTIAGDLGEPQEHFIKEKSQPYAFALPLCAHKVHTVVPVTGTDERQAVFSGPEAHHDGPHAVVVQIDRFSRLPGRS